MNKKYLKILQKYKKICKNNKKVLKKIMIFGKIYTRIRGIKWLIQYAQ